MRGRLLTGVLIAALAVGLPAGALATQAHIAKKHHKHHKHHKTKTSTTGAKPELEVIGFQVNRLFVANGADITDTADCSTSVGGNGYLDGPPQNVYFGVYVKVVGVPLSTDVEVAYSYPEGEFSGDEQPTLMPSGPLSNLLSDHLLGFGEPPDTKNVYDWPLSSGDAANGPSSSDFDGQYTASIEANIDGQSETSTANATVDCPQG